MRAYRRGRVRIVLHFVSIIAPPLDAAKRMMKLLVEKFIPYVGKRGHMGHFVDGVVAVRRLSRGLKGEKLY